MKLMRNLTRLTLCAAIVPILTLGTGAIAQGQSNSDLQVEEPGEGAIEHPAEERRSEGQGSNGQDSEAQRSGEQDSDGMRFYEHTVEQQFINQMPAGAIYTDDLIGKPVRNRQSGDRVGEIHDLVIGEDGRILGVLVTTGGFLGLGGQNVSLNWDQLQHSMEEDESVFHTDLDRATLRNAPKFERD